MIGAINADDYDRWKLDSGYDEEDPPEEQTEDEDTIITTDEHEKESP